MRASVPDSVQGHAEIGDPGLRVAPGTSGFGASSSGAPAGLRKVGSSRHDPSAEATSLTEVGIRLLDLVGAIALLVLLSPLLLLVALVVKLDSPGPAIFRQRRVGRGERQFSVVKFRTMRTGSDVARHRQYVERMIVANDGDRRPMEKLQDDGRITRVGGFLRRASLDELPQLWNVVRGEMSLVGPRPPIQYEVDKYPPEAFRRFEVRPGITGLWQVQGRSLLSFRQMIALDTEYVERRSLLLNLKIILLTVPTVISGRGAG